MKKKANSYDGDVATEPEHGTTRAGKVFTRFALRVEKDLIDCVMWHTGLEEGCEPDALELGSRITVRGFWGERKATDYQPAREEFVVRWFASTNSQAAEEKGWNEKLYEWFGGREKFRELRAQDKAIMEGRGLVLIVKDGQPCWVAKKYCVMFNGKWVEKIDFVMDVLGVKFVTDAIKQSGPYPEILENLLRQARSLLDARQREEVSAASLSS